MGENIENFLKALNANISNSEVAVETTDVLGTFNLLDSNSINSLEVFCVDVKSDQQIVEI
jgi:hypothetical protein